MIKTVSISRESKLDSKGREIESRVVLTGAIGFQEQMLGAGNSKGARPSSGS